MITLLTATQGNPVALSRTIESAISTFGGYIDQVAVIGLCPFPGDTEIIPRIKHVSFFKEMELAQLYNKGFAETFNEVVHDGYFPDNNLVLYLNVGEVIEGPVRVDLLKPDHNCYMFDHATETHKWVRLYNRKDLRWSGRIHEEIIGTRRLCPDILFRMADTHKDNDDRFKSWVYNYIKELVYFNQYRTIWSNPQERFATNEGWIKWSGEQFHYHTERINRFPELLESFLADDKEQFLQLAKAAYESSPEFANNDMIHFQ